MIITMINGITLALSPVFTELELELLELLDDEVISAVCSDVSPATTSTVSTLPVVTVYPSGTLFTSTLYSPSGRFLILILPFSSVV